MKTRPQPLPIDDALVEDTKTQIDLMNRSERRVVHRHLLTVSKTANDKSVTDNDNIVACRVSHDDALFLETLVADHGTSVSNWLRDLITAQLKKERSNVAA